MNLYINYVQSNLFHYLHFVTYETERSSFTNNLKSCHPDLKQISLLNHHPFQARSVVLMELKSNLISLEYVPNFIKGLGYCNRSLSTSTQQPAWNKRPISTNYLNYSTVNHQR